MRLLFVAGLPALYATCGTAAVADTQPRIVVEGVATVHSPPDVAHVTYAVRGEGRTSDQAVSSMVAIGGRIEQALRAIDPAIDPRSETVKVMEVRDPACEKDDYDRLPRLSTGPCTVIGYIASQEIRIRTSRVADAGTIVGLAGREGASNPEIDDFSLDNEKAAKDRAIAIALADARSKALAIAAGSNVQLGALMSVTMDGARDGVIVVTGSLMQRTGTVSRAPIAVSVSPEPIATSARVTVTFGIQR